MEGCGDRSGGSDAVACPPKPDESRSPSSKRSVGLVYFSLVRRPHGQEMNHTGELMRVRDLEELEVVPRTAKADSPDRLIAARVAAGQCPAPVSPYLPRGTMPAHGSGMINIIRKSVVTRQRRRQTEGGPA